MQEAQRAVTENKMGVMPLNKLLINMAGPMIISQIVLALYNIVDSVFVAKLCEDALSAVSLAYPIQVLIIAIGIGTGYGINAMLSRCLGAKDQDGADRAAKHGVFLAACSYIVFLLFGLLLSRSFYTLQTDNQAIVQYGHDYLSVMCIASFGTFGQMVYERLLQSTGKTTLAMITQGVGAIVNLILDPIMIFGLLGCPRMEVAGAALATVTGQCVAAGLAMYFCYHKNPEVNCRMRGFRPDKATIGRIYRVGVPGIFMQAISSIMNFGMNQVLIGFTSTATAVFGVYFKAQAIIFQPIFGITSALSPIIAYNYGAGKRSRIYGIMKLGYIYAGSIMLVGTILFEAAPGFILRLFSASDQMLAIGIPALRIISSHFVMGAFCIITIATCTALGKSIYSLVISFSRQLLVLLPSGWLLGHFFGLHAVWWSFVIAEFASVTAAALCLAYINKTLIKKIPDGQ
ncbi:MAG: MATE family efflux transporter [Clostridia bacterium]|nr:MATE family efflux transporter [Clostridia bacterium]